jgi:hypothetical protein
MRRFGPGAKAPFLFAAKRPEPKGSGYLEAKASAKADSSASASLRVGMTKKKVQGKDEPLIQVVRTAR